MFGVMVTVTGSQFGHLLPVLIGPQHFGQFAYICFSYRQDSGGHARLDSGGRKSATAEVGVVVGAFTYG